MSKWLIGLITAGALLGVGVGVAIHATPRSTITVTGATASAPLIRAAAEDYPELHVTMTRTNAQTGLTSVAAKRVTLGASDVFAKAPGRLVDHPIAVVGIAPVVNPHTGVHTLTATQLRQIFTKQVTNWRQVGGNDLKIIVASRTQGSETRTNFTTLALNGTSPVADRELRSTEAMQRFVQSHTGAIGFLPFGALSKRLTPVALDGITPTPANVITNRWRLWAYAHLYTNGSPSITVARFIHTLQSNTKLITTNGDIPLRAMQVARTSDGMIEDTHN